jgi:hypothetical protein
MKGVLSTNTGALLTREWSGQELDRTPAPGRETVQTAGSTINRMNVTHCQSCADAAAPQVIAQKIGVRSEGVIKDVITLLCITESPTKRVIR